LVENNQGMQGTLTLCDQNQQALAWMSVSSTDLNSSETLLFRTLESPNSVA
jgi:hypothetical protein